MQIERKMDVLEIRIRANKLEMLALWQDAATSALQDLLERHAAINCRTTDSHMRSLNDILELPWDTHIAPSPHGALMTVKS